MDLSLVHNVLAALTPPIEGVSIENAADYSSWTIWRDGMTIKLTDDAPALAVAQGPIMAVALAVPDPSAGIQITSTSNSALNGTYAIDPTTQNKLTSIAAYVAVNQKFPAGQATLAWPDAAGVLHQGFTTSQFLALGSVIADYVTGVELARTLLSTGNLAEWPATSVTIS